MVIALAPMVVSTIFSSNSKNDVISILSPLSPLQTIAHAVEKINENALGDLTSEYLINDNEVYGVYIKNLATGQSYGYNENMVFETASLYKLWVMATTFQKISEDKLKISDTISGDLENFDKQLLISTNSLTTEESQSKEERKISFSLENAIEKMITVSDNYAALSLVGKVGDKSINNFLDENGLLSSKFNHPPTSTPSDIGLFYELLYQGKLVTPELSLQMMDILKRQKINDRIPKYLPEGTVVGHKTGELDEFKNDAGIVYSGKGDFIIVFFSKTKDPYIAAEKIAKFSKAVYDYFNK